MSELVLNATHNIELNAHDSLDVLLNMWLHGKSKTTQSSYSKIAYKFIDFVQLPLTQIGLNHLQSWLDTIEGSDNTRKTYASVIKSLFTFTHNLGLMSVNPGKALKVGKPKDCLNERILTESEVMLMIHQESNHRNKLILKTLYYCGLRVSELCVLKWKDASVRTNGGQFTVYGKGQKTRTVLVPPSLWQELIQLKAEPDESVFSSRKKADNAHLDRTQVFRIVKNAAKRIGIDNPSPHWLRHSHASHSLDRGCPIHLLSNSLGHASVSTTSRYLHSRPEDCSSLYLIN
ncbi:tyrosine-type recombinase/integrase [Anabaena sp. UHCC 0253]|uniref:tyrosine-type recombinase/integrase n=1 Tax=Anabaena sp. UHCC 0253 TaxID=2590019 RepID=UPI0014459D72|nr:tyrosine-type recombinase/integrase [Anabaena sp. UHCC 0253]MTJ55804.1 tyrosine-type recombinase/integrase [Anabaena sp. UHCC 0253]